VFTHGSTRDGVIKAATRGACLRHSACARGSRTQ
jgi:hypothetical protein